VIFQFVLRCFLTTLCASENIIFCIPEWLASDALELPAQVLDIATQGANPIAPANRRNINRSINLPDRISETGYLQSSAGDDIFSDMLEGHLMLAALIRALIEF
jgi:hypothetical protein